MAAADDPYQHKTLALSRLVRFGESRAPVSPRDVALLLGVNIYHLVKQSLENPQEQDSRMDERLQTHLHNVVRVIARAHKSFGDVAVALRWYQRYEAPEFASKTPEALTALGRVDDVLRLIEDGAPPKFGNKTE